MRGPGYKTSLDVRRTWKCPACGKTRKQMGDVTTMLCECRDGGVFMTIAGEKIVAPRPFQQLSQEDVRSSTFGIEDMPVLLPHPNSLPPEPTGPRRPRPGSDNAAAKSNPATDEPSSPAETSSVEKAQEKPEPTPATPPPTVSPPAQPSSEPEDDWGEGIL